ncbi:MAG: DUF1731 domain-containing protein [Flavobacteriia bacterium]|nr:DUF1731 domain-containing protein [Flavobacteriia bacterium]
MKVILGKRSILILQGYAVDNHKLTNTNFTFKYKTIEDALQDLI